MQVSHGWQLEASRLLLLLLLLLTRVLACVVVFGADQEVQGMHIKTNDRAIRKLAAQCTSYEAQLQTATMALERRDESLAAAQSVIAEVSLCFVQRKNGGDSCVCVRVRVRVPPGLRIDWAANTHAARVAVIVAVEEHCCRS